MTDIFKKDKKNYQNTFQHNKSSTTTHKAIPSRTVFDTTTYKNKHNFNRDFVILANGI